MPEQVTEKAIVAPSPYARSLPPKEPISCTFTVPAGSLFSLNYRVLEPWSHDEAELASVFELPIVRVVQGDVVLIDNAHSRGSRVPSDGAPVRVTFTSPVPRMLAVLAHVAYTRDGVYNHAYPVWDDAQWVDCAWCRDRPIGEPRVGFDGQLHWVSCDRSTTSTPREVHP